MQSDKCRNAVFLIAAVKFTKAVRASVYYNPDSVFIGYKCIKLLYVEIRPNIILENTSKYQNCKKTKKVI